MENQNALKIEYVPIDNLSAYQRTIRKHPKQQRQKAKMLLERYGQVLPIIADSDYVIIDGHLIWATMKELGYEQIAVVISSNRNPEDIRLLRLALNRVSDETQWDKKEQAIEFQALMDIGAELEFSAFDAVEIEAALYVGDTEQEPDENPFEHADLDTPAVSQRGDMWLLGEHRLLCGNALERASFQTLLGDELARLAFVDVPYNVPISGHVCGLGKIQHAEFAMASGEMSEAEFVDFIKTAMSRLREFSCDGSIHYVCIDWRHEHELLTAGKQIYTEHKNLCVWSKSNAGMGSFYRSQHELVHVFKNGKAKHVNNVELGKHGRMRSNVWCYPGVNTFGKDRMAELVMHPTVKPVALVADAILDASQKGDLILDSFCGSGTTIIAAERTGRKARAIEIEPKYVDVGVQRWQNETGEHAIHAQTGETFADAQARILEGCDDA